MAEAEAAIELVASIASLVDRSMKVVSRIRDYNLHVADVPTTFRSLSGRFRLLTKTLTRVRSRAQAGQISGNVAKELNVLIENVCEQVKLVEQYLESCFPASDSSRFDRVLIRLESLAKYKKVKEAVEKIHHGINVLVHHQATRVVEVSEPMPQKLRRLGLQSPPLQQPVPHVAVPQMFGICLGQAPLIEPDAFIGRQAEIQQLHQWLSPPQNTQGQRVVSIVGMSGLGKTQLSLAYARQYGHRYSSVFWLNAEDETTLRQSMSALTAMIFPDRGVVTTNADEEGLPVQKVRRWLSEISNDQWLIIFDNYDDSSLPNPTTSPTGFDIRQFFPMRVQGSILITTRSSKLALSKPLRLQKLDDMGTGLAVLYHRSRRKITQDPDARRLAVRLDGLPLALAVAGTYLAQTKASFTEYLDLYNTAWNEYYDHDIGKLIKYEDRILSSTWAISLDQIQQQNTDVAELFQFLGYLSNNDIWYELVKSGTKRGPPWIGRVTASKIHFDQAMSKLGDYSLVEARGGSYRVRPYLHDWIFEHLDTPLSRSLFKTAVICIARSIPNRPDPQYWTASHRMVNHLHRIQDPRFTILWDNNTSDQSILNASHSFGNMCRDLCEFDIAEKMYLRALAGKEKALGPEHRLTLRTVSNLGRLYYYQGRLDEAEQMFTRALAEKEKALGPDHESTLGAVDKLGIIYRDRGRLDEAEQMHTRALAGKEKARGPDHNSTLCTVENLGILYRVQGRLDKSEQMHGRALTGWEKTLGSDHTLTLGTISNLGLLYCDQGRLDKAEQMYMQALAGYEKISLSHTISALNINYHLGMLYKSQGKLDEAKDMFQRALIGKRKVLGPDHQHTKQVADALKGL